MYELNNWQRNITNNFPLKIDFFGTVKLLRNAIKSKFILKSWGIAFDWEGLWSFGNDFARNVVFFGVDNSSLSHNNNRRHNFLVLHEGPTDGINDGTGAAEKKISINFSKAKTKFCLNLHYNSDDSYLSLNKTEIFRMKANDNIRWYNLCLGLILHKQSEIFLNSSVYDFSVDHSSSKKWEIISIHEYLMVKNNIK